MDDQTSSPIDDVDRISCLPDDIIIIILSHLFVEESARTSILSKRWHKFWLLSPLIISDESIVKNSNNYSNQLRDQTSYGAWIINTLYHILNTHPGPVHTCHFALPIWEENEQAIVHFLKAVVRKGIQYLQLSGEDNTFVVPCFVLECKSLVEAVLSCVRIPTRLRAGRKIFPNLRKLSVHLCNVNHQFMSELFSSKSITELEFCAYELQHVFIESSSLQKLTFSVFTVGDHNPPTKLVIKNVPNLEYFYSYEELTSCKVIILNAPKLRVLDFTSMKLLLLQIGNCRFSFYEEFLKVSGEAMHMPSLQYLDIIVDFNYAYEAKSIAYYFLCFPCLETLIVEMVDSSSNSSTEDNDGNDDNNDGNDDNIGDGDDGNNDPHIGEYEEDGNDDVIGFVANEFGYPKRVNMNSLNYHLKHVTLKYFSGKQSQLDLAVFIVSEARVLETMTLFCSTRTKFAEEYIEGVRQLLMHVRASMVLTVEFLKY